MTRKKTIQNAARTCDMTVERFTRVTVEQFTRSALASDAAFDMDETGELKTDAECARHTGNQQRDITEEEAAALRQEGIAHDPRSVRAVCFFTPEEIEAMRSDRWLGCVGLEGDQALALGRAARLGVQIYLKLVENGTIRWR